MYFVRVAAIDAAPLPKEACRYRLPEGGAVVAFRSKLCAAEFAAKRLGMGPVTAKTAARWLSSALQEGDEQCGLCLHFLKFGWCRFKCRCRFLHPPQFERRAFRVPSLPSQVSFERALTSDSL